MTRISFLYDRGNADGSIGGAELTMREFSAAAPENAEPVELSDAQTVVIGNCTSFGPDLIDELSGKRVIRYHNDLARHEHPDLREWLDRNATHAFCSQLHQDHYGLDGVWPNIPPALDLKRFGPSRQVKRNGKRSGAVAVASFQNPDKGAQLLAEWAAANGGLTVYGTGSYVPDSPAIDFRGALPYENVPNVLWAAETFVHLPTAVEPFGRAVVEAWAAGCELVVNELVGALGYLRSNHDALRSAARDFWRLAL